jgi:hypothetical protein
VCADFEFWGMSAQDLDLALTSYARLQAETARRALGFYRTRTKSAAIPPALAATAEATLPELLHWHGRWSRPAPGARLVTPRFCR